MLARLHTTRPPTGIQVPSRSLDLPSPQAIDRALASLDIPCNGGPYAESARRLLARHQHRLRQAQAQFDALRERVQSIADMKNLLLSHLQAM